MQWIYSSTLDGDMTTDKYIEGDEMIAQEVVKPTDQYTEDEMNAQDNVKARDSKSMPG